MSKSKRNDTEVVYNAKEREIVVRPESIEYGFQSVVKF